MTRKFIWAKAGNNAGVSLVGWNQICKPKTEGGLGLKRLGEMNEAFMLKLGWGLVSKTDDLWVRVLRGKYLQTRDNENMIPNQGSRLWRHICKLWPLIQRSIRFRLGDGKTANFWTDRWLNFEETLLMKARKPVEWLQDKNMYFQVGTGEL